MASAADQSELLLKFLIIGDAGVGKSWLLQYFLHRESKKKTSHTVGVQFGSKVLTVAGKQVKLQIWDTAGQDRFRSVARNYYRGAICCLLVYDITCRDSFTHLLSWLEDARSLARSELQIVLVGNKTDLADRREVTLLEASQFAQEHSLLFLETSAVTGDCVDEVFLKCTSAVVQDVEAGVVDAASLAPKPLATPQEEAVAAGCRC